MAGLAELPGEPTAVHFERLEAGRATGAGIMTIGVVATILQQIGGYDPSVIPMPKLGR
jgi:hypothetical protein